MAVHHSPPRSPPTTPPISTAIPSYTSIPYSSAFTDALSSYLQSSSSTSNTRNNNNPNDDPTSHHTGIHVLPIQSTQSTRPISRPPPPRASLPLSSIQETSIPVIEVEQLPLPLGDPRRIYNGAIPGVLLTHPGGYYEGGPCTTGNSATPISLPLQLSLSQAHQAPPPPPQSSTYASFVQNFLARNPHLSSLAELQRAIMEETEAQLEKLKAQLRERNECKVKNAEVEKKLEDLIAQREVERVVEERILKGGRRGGD